MFELITNPIKIILQALSQFPMPWRAAAAVLLMLIALRLVWDLVFWFAENLALFLGRGFALLLLWPEYQFTRFFRKKGHNPPAVLYLPGDILSGSANILADLNSVFTNISQRRWLLSKRWIALFVATPILLWYVYPSVRDSPVAPYIELVFDQWYLLEEWALPR